MKLNNKMSKNRGPTNIKEKQLKEHVLFAMLFPVPTSWFVTVSSLKGIEALQRNR